MKLQYLTASAVRRACRAKGKRASKDFLYRLDAFVGRKLNAACAVHNGGRKTLDLTIAEFVGLLQ